MRDNKKHHPPPPPPLHSYSFHTSASVVLQLLEITQKITTNKIK